MFKTTLIAAAVAATLPLAALAEGIMIEGAYARSSGPQAASGAAFMVLVNQTGTDDRLVSVASPAAERIELHTHIEDADGVMRMREVEAGFAVPAGGSHALERGADHVMFLGLTAPFEDGAMVPLSLTFERAGTIEIEVPVDLTRMPRGHGGMDHGAMGHNAMDHGNGHAMGN